MVYDQSCVCLDDLLVSRLLSVTTPRDGKKAFQYRVLDACEAGIMGINDHPFLSQPM